jgi:hypothetical protein
LVCGKVIADLSKEELSLQQLTQLMAGGEGLQEDE